MSKKEIISKNNSINPLASVDPREIVANTPNSKYTIENIDNKKLIQKLSTKDGKIASVIYAPNGNEVVTISNKKKKQLPKVE